MFEVLLYLCVAYAGAIAMGFILWMRTRHARERRLRVIRYGYPVLLLAPLLPYAVVECQTAVLWPILSEPTRKALLDDGFSDRIVFHKVLLACPGWTKVYVVTPCLSRESESYASDSGEYRGTVAWLVWRSRGWKIAGDPNYSNWGAVWSDCGSASGNVFPPYLLAK
jgi:hypothetical protein